MIKEDNQIKEGYLYCIHNKCYKIYGENIYKIGKAQNITKRVASRRIPGVQPAFCPWAKAGASGWHHI